MQISFHSHLDSNTVIATKFCTWHDSCAVVACAKICCDLMPGRQRSYHKAKFPSNLICGQKTVSETGPRIRSGNNETSWFVSSTMFPIYISSGKHNQHHRKIIGRIQRILSIENVLFEKHLLYSWIRHRWGIWSYCIDDLSRKVNRAHQDSEIFYTETKR